MSNEGQTEREDCPVRGPKSEEKIYRVINYHLAARNEFKKNSVKSFFHKEILSHYVLIVGDENEFRKFIG